MQSRCESKTGIEGIRALRLNLLSLRRGSDGSIAKEAQSGIHPDFNNLSDSSEDVRWLVATVGHN